METKIDESKIKNDEQFKYLDSVVSTDGNGVHDTKTRLAQAIESMFRIWKCKEVCLDVKKRLLWSVDLYSFESWAPKKSDCRRIAAFGFWVWGRILKIS